MGDIVLFRPATHRRAAENLNEFVAFARTRLTVFGADLDWDADVWELNGVATVSGRKRILRAHWRQITGKSGGGEAPLRSGNDDFFKAYLRYSHGLAPKMNVGMDLSAIRCLDHAMSRLPRSIAELRPDDLNIAASLAAERFARQTAYRVGVSLGNLAEFMRRHELLARPFTWANPIRRPSGHDRIGPDRERNTARAMPREGVVEALGDAYRRAKEPMDVLALSVFALLLATHARLAEIHRINADGCEVEDERNGETRYGLRWHPAKGAQPETRWIPTAFVDLARDALRRIRDVTEPGRALARRYETGQPVLPPASQGDAGAVTPGDLMAWGMGENSLRVLLKRVGLPHPCLKATVFDRSLVEEAFRRDLPPDFPFSDERSGLRFSESLMTIRKAIQPRYSNSPWRIASVKSDLIVQIICGHDGRPGVLERLDCRDAERVIARITPHQLRHLLTTLAHEGGLSQLDISRWAGRKDAAHNHHYDHETMDSLIDRARSNGGDMFGKASVATPNGPVSVADFIRGDLPAIHLTEFGVCRHDFSALPCPMHRDCLACVEHACIKGDARAERSLRERLLVMEHARASAARANSDGAFGAGIWKARSEAELARLRALVAILDDPTIPLGAVVAFSDGPDAEPRVETDAPEAAMLGEDVRLMSDVEPA